ncbi:maleylpyruvate isomerase family mycothiol-dependent enzyme [Nocardioides flavescens]|uniref:Maleylpyruvate isomerase family mycothiol-dependent enzyme n=1 Tax=Nocardioides flavescens TaxID=2691959 RepID=A0A6L7EXM6_9ACTN|nr:maleylpyruvate isomerase family mycothiol-dependent enzyme [Nocardioides flavescens]MXG88441.1 maleylpyruvate isomerase family mycothiol-dependent enzyme [Nocardioides flavescens]
MTEDPFTLIAAERLALADLVDSLSAEQLAAQSLCGRWSVQDVAAHLLVGPTTSLPAFAWEMVRARGSFDRASERVTARLSDRPAAEIAAMLREHADSRFTPPGMDWHAPLTDLLVHREDIAVPLDLPHDRPLESWRHALDFLVSPKARTGFTPGGRPAVRLVAEDVDWIHGPASAPEARGPAYAVGLVLTGRPAGLPLLTGPGVDALAGWGNAFGNGGRVD